MSKIKKFLLVMVVAIPIAIGVLFLALFILVIYTYFTPHYNKKEDSKTYASIDSFRIEYQEKVYVDMTTHYTDTLSIRIAPYDEDVQYPYSYEYKKEILSGDFYRTAWYDDKVFIYSGDLFYVFDIDEYEVPEAGEEPEYELHEYTIFEMDELYPDFRDFDWEGWGD